MENKRILIIGQGRWGICIKSMLGGDCIVDTWDINTNNIECLNCKINYNEIVIFAIPTNSLDELLNKINITEELDQDRAFIAAMKGVDKEGKLPYEIFLRHGISSAALLGPAQPEDIYNDKKVVLGLYGYTNDLENYFFNPNVKILTFSSDEIPAAQFGAAMKNVAGIAGGILDGLNEPSLKGYLMSELILEVCSLSGILFNNPTYPLGLSHLADYGTTFFHEQSVNRQYGYSLVHPCYYDLYFKTIEGKDVILNIHSKISQVLHPILYNIYEIVNEEKLANSLLETLMRSN